MPGDHRVHCVPQAVLIEPTAQRDIELHRIHIVAALCGAGVKQQPLLQGGQRQHVSDAVLPLQLVDLLLAQAGGAISEGVNPPPPPRTCAQMPASASNHNRLSRLTCA